MRKKKNLDLAAEMGEDVDVTEEEANDANQIVSEPEPIATVVPAPAASLSVSIADIQAIVKSAVEAATSGNAAMASAVTKGIADAREPIPENKFSPGISVLNPLGDRDHPRPGLKCKMTWATQDAKTQVVKPTYPFEDADLSAQEQIALNTLEPWTGVVELLDGSPIKVAVVPTYNAIDDSLERLAIVVPSRVTEKASQIKNMLPPILNLVEQITGVNFAKLSKDDLAWFMAEHRAKRYVAAREAVAA